MQELRFLQESVACHTRDLHIWLIEGNVWQLHNFTLRSHEFASQILRLLVYTDNLEALNHLPKYVPIQVLDKLITKIFFILFQSSPTLKFAPYLMSIWPTVQAFCWDFYLRTFFGRNIFVFFIENKEKTCIPGSPFWVTLNVFGSPNISFFHNKHIVVITCIYHRLFGSQ